MENHKKNPTVHNVFNLLTEAEVSALEAACNAPGKKTTRLATLMEDDLILTMDVGRIKSGSKLVFTAVKEATPEQVQQGLEDKVCMFRVNYCSKTKEMDTINFTGKKGLKEELYGYLKTFKDTQMEFNQNFLAAEREQHSKSHKHRFKHPVKRFNK